MNRIKELVEILYDSLTCVTIAIIGIAYFNVQFAARVFCWAVIFEFILGTVKKYVRARRSHVGMDEKEDTAEKTQKD